MISITRPPWPTTGPWWNHRPNRPVWMGMILSPRIRGSRDPAAQILGHVLLPPPWPVILLSYPMAYFLAFRVKKHKALWLILLTIPFWTSYLLRVFAWKIVLGFNGAINSGLKAMGVISEPLSFLLYNPMAVTITLCPCLDRFHGPSDLCLAGENRPIAARGSDGSGRQQVAALLARDPAAVRTRNDRSRPCSSSFRTVGDYVTPHARRRSGRHDDRQPDPGSVPQAE